MCMCVCVCVCVVGKMAKDIGMTIRKSIVVSFLPCFFGIPSLHVLSKMFFCYLFLFFLGGGGENHGLLNCTAAACSYINRR